MDDSGAAAAPAQEGQHFIGMLTCRGGGTGRRSGLKIPWPSGRVGSIPTPGTFGFATTLFLFLAVALLASATQRAISRQR
jgi:hypothetical protein